MNRAARVLIWPAMAIAKTALVAVLLVCVCIAVGQRLAEATR